MSQDQPIGETFHAEGLKTMTFAPIKAVVPEILIEGLTLFAGKPKTGKSWLLLHAAIAVARGGFTLGNTHCIEGDVLYCALEDSKRRLKKRMEKLIGVSQDWPKRLSFRCEMPRLSAGGLDVIRDWIASHPLARLVIIDTLAMVRSPKKQDQSTYDSDYAAVLELRKLAIEFGIAIVVVHHLRKADADDAFDTISGTLGLTGAPDTILVLKRDGAGAFVLHGKGRDLIEIEKAMSFDRSSCLWRIEGDAPEVRRSSERTAVLEAVEEAGAPIGPSTIAQATGMKPVNVRKLLTKLVREGAIKKGAKYGQYQAAGFGEPNAPTNSKRPARPSTSYRKTKSDDLDYTDPIVDVPDLGADPLDEHGVRTASGGGAEGAEASNGLQVLGPEPDHACLQCNINDGQVLLIRYNFGRDITAKPLHEHCAPFFFGLRLSLQERDELKRRGFSDDDLFEMSPKRAHEILADPSRTAEAPQEEQRGSATDPGKCDR